MIVWQDISAGLAGATGRLFVGYYVCVYGFRRDGEDISPVDIHLLVPIQVEQSFVEDGDDFNGWGRERNDDRASR